MLGCIQLVVAFGYSVELIECELVVRYNFLLYNLITMMPIAPNLTDCLCCGYAFDTRGRGVAN